jgi:hypothetical protein
LNREECALYIDIEQLVKMFFGDVAEGHEFADAGVGEDNIDSSFHFADCLVEKVKIGHFGNVALNTGHIGTDCLHGLVKLLLAAPCDENISTFIDEQLAVASPIPSVQPVMMATLPSSFFVIALSFVAELELASYLMVVEPLPNVRNSILIERLV